MYCGTLGEESYDPAMNDVTTILSAIEPGDSAAADKLLPLVYQELRKLAAAKLAKEKQGQSLQPTMLVHEAYLRLVDVDERVRFVGIFEQICQTMAYAHSRQTG